MVVVDSSALIPLSWVGRLGLVETTFETVRTTDAVRDEVLVEGKPGTASLQHFLKGVEVVETPPQSEEVATLEGIAVADASVILMAADDEAILLGNDMALIEVARSHGVECWWVTTLLLHGAKSGALSATEAVDILYDLVDAGMNLDPNVYAQVQRKLQELGD
ncbi:hypothetical protein HLRTI_000718 [Halorhabdus tiamatea SARL4B]|uniref:Nucleic acid-binding protein n=1 Tax=Halorhabdus tiamatea SARL4B TaxID=1033806 RepID=F7PP81_9EURY|nr:hypothetical protein [Halorhabdus tiamatea]ERJ07124.1 hypothetical protein HLRTI_000718 [Halorhabdus tiamatea SARL4B]CCQ32745.1 hypothetical protein HTIA_0601 [Halorhabdus tiamatea SARL4B]